MYVRTEYIFRRHAYIPVHRMQGGGIHGEMKGLSPAKALPSQRVSDCNIVTFFVRFDATRRLRPIQCSFSFPVTVTSVRSSSRWSYVLVHLVEQTTPEGKSPPWAMDAWESGSLGLPPGAGRRYWYVTGPATFGQTQSITEFLSNTWCVC